MDILCWIVISMSALEMAITAQTLSKMACETADAAKMLRYALRLIGLSCMVRCINHLHLQQSNTAGKEGPETCRRGASSMQNACEWHIL